MIAKAKHISQLKRAEEIMLNWNGGSGGGSARSIQRRFNAVGDAQGPSNHSRLVHVRAGTALDSTDGCHEAVLAARVCPGGGRTRTYTTPGSAREAFLGDFELSPVQPGYTAGHSQQQGCGRGTCMIPGPASHPESRRGDFNKPFSFGLASPHLICWLGGRPGRVGLQLASAAH